MTPLELEEPVCPDCGGPLERRNIAKGIVYECVNESCDMIEVQLHIDGTCTVVRETVAG